MSFKGIEESLVGVTDKTFCNRKASYKYNPEAVTVEYDVIFDNAVIDELGVTSTHPAITVNLSKLNRYPSHKDTITIDTVEYRILDIRPDGIGGVLILLAR